MSKIRKLLKNSLIIATSLSFAAPFTLLTSCESEHEEEDPIVNSIKLEAEDQAEQVSPGQSVQINAMINGTDRIYNKLNWQLKNLPFEGPFITASGLLSITPEIYVSDVSEITIVATSIDNPDVGAELPFKIAPKIDDFLKGFKDNQILGLRPKGVEYVQTPINIIRHGNRYETEEPICAFQELPGPREWGSIIHFEPLFSNIASTHEMRFDYVDTKTQQHGVQFMNYIRGEPTESIPDLMCTDSSSISESIIVTFDCQPDVEFIIHFNLYQEPGTQDTPIVISYDQQPGDPHQITGDDQGMYTSHLFCPKYLSRQIYRENMSTIYIFRNYFEYTNLDKEVIIDPQSNLPSDIKEAFSFRYDWEKLVRPTDQYIYYKLSIYYSFDLSKISPTKHKNDGYPSYHLIEIDITDEVTREYGQLAGKLDFYLSWV